MWTKTQFDIYLEQIEYVQEALDKMPAGDKKAEIRRITRNFKEKIMRAINATQEGREVRTSTQNRIDEESIKLDLILDMEELLNES